MSQVPVWMQMVSIGVSLGVIAAVVGAIGGYALFKYQIWKEKRNSEVR